MSCKKHISAVQLVCLMAVGLQMLSSQVIAQSGNSSLNGSWVWIGDGRPDFNKKAYTYRKRQVSFYNGKSISWRFNEELKTFESVGSSKFRLNPKAFPKQIDSFNIKDLTGEALPGLFDGRINQNIYKLDGNKLIIESDHSGKSKISKRPHRYVDLNRDRWKGNNDSGLVYFGQFLVDGRKISRQVYERVAGFPLIWTESSRDSTLAVFNNATPDTYRLKIRLTIKNDQVSLVSASDTKDVRVAPGKNVSVSWQIKVPEGVRNPVNFRVVEKTIVD